VRESVAARKREVVMDCVALVLRMSMVMKAPRCVGRNCAVNALLNTLCRIYGKGWRRAILR
jgi:hypothetical protein